MSRARYYINFTFCIINLGLVLFNLLVSNNSELALFAGVCAVFTGSAAYLSAQQVKNENT